MTSTQLPTTLPMRFDYYLTASEAWAALLKPFLNQNKTVVELCPGWSPKILMACLCDNFSGEYIAVDTSEDSLAELKHFYERLSPDFSFKKLTADVMMSDLPSAQIIIMNHVLDDILINEFGEENYNISFLKKFWNDMSEQENLDSELQTLAKELAEKVVGSLQPGGKLFVHQYPGYQEKLHDIPEAWKVCQVFLKYFIRACIELNCEKENTEPIIKENSFFTADHLCILSKKA